MKKNVAGSFKKTLVGSEKPSGGKWLEAKKTLIKLKGPKKPSDGRVFLTPTKCPRKPLLVTKKTPSLLFTMVYIFKDVGELRTAVDLRCEAKHGAKGQYGDITS